MLERERVLPPAPTLTSCESKRFIVTADLPSPHFPKGARTHSSQGRMRIKITSSSSSEAQALGMGAVHPRRNLHSFLPHLPSSAIRPGVRHFCVKSNTVMLGRAKRNTHSISSEVSCRQTRGSLWATGFPGSLMILVPSSQLWTCSARPPACQHLILMDHVRHLKPPHAKQSPASPHLHTCPSSSFCPRNPKIQAVLETLSTVFSDVSVPFSPYFPHSKNNKSNSNHIHRMLGTLPSIWHIAVHLS